MSFYSKNHQKNNILRRCFVYQNVYDFTKIEKTTISFTINYIILFKTLLKIATFLELITNQRSFFIRTKKALVTKKVRWGTPIGAKITLRKTNFFYFLTKLNKQILPNIKNLSIKIHKNTLNSFSLVIPSILIFPELQVFYFFFSCFVI